MEEEEGAAEVEDLLPSGLQSGFFTSDFAAEEILLSLPELEEEEVAGALGDFHQRVVVDCRDHHVHGGGVEIFPLVLFVDRDFDDVGFFQFRHC